MCGEIGTGPYEDLCVNVYESDRRIFYRNTRVGLGLHGQAFGSMRATEVSSGRGAGSFLPVQQSQSLEIQRQKCCWTRMGQLEMVATPL